MEAISDKEAVIEGAKYADLVGASSANPQAVYEEWTTLGLAPYFKEIACQDKGSKAQIIRESLAMGYEKKDVVMFGDAVGDLKATQENGVYFFPIIPEKEKESWAKFLNEALEILISGRFDDAYQKQLIDEFYASLSQGA